MRGPPHPAQANGPVPAPTTDAPPFTAPLLLWLSLQLLALLTALLRVPLAAQYPQPAELLAAQVMVVVQVTAVALLFPYLLRDVRSVAAVVAATLPFLVLSGAVSGIPAGRLVLAGIYVVSWIVALAAWNVRASTSGRSAGVAAATLLTLGTLVAFYLRLEYAADAAGEPAEQLARWAPASPPLAALRLLTNPPRAADWCTPVGVLTTAILWRLAARRSRQVIHSA